MNKALLSILVAAFCLPNLVLSQNKADQDNTPDDDISGIGGRKAKNQSAQKILFIGNSYTASAGGQSNLVPKLLAARGQEPAVETHIRAGETLEGFWLKNLGNDPTYWERKTLGRQKTEDDKKNYLAKIQEGRKKTIGKLDAVLKKGPYDVVILQSWTGARMPEKDLGFQKYAKLLVEKIRESSPKAKLVLYMTWSSQNDRKAQAKVNENCLKAAQDNRMVIAPAGEAAWAVREIRQDLLLYRTDKDSHPGHDGGYLIACSLVAAITDQSPVGLPHEFKIPWSYDFPIGVKDPQKKEKMKTHGPGKEYLWSISPKKAALLQKVAWDTYQISRQKLAKAK